MSAFIPKVSEFDVTRVINRDFRGADREVAQKTLVSVEGRQWHSKPRIHLAILKLSNGNVDELDRQLHIAASDFREVLFPAECPRAFALGLVAASKLTQEAREELIRQDWDDYLQWLNS